MHAVYYFPQGPIIPSSRTKMMLPFIPCDKLSITPIIPTCSHREVEQFWLANPLHFTKLSKNWTCRLFDLHNQWKERRGSVLVLVHNVSIMVRRTTKMMTTDGVGRSIIPWCFGRYTYRKCSNFSSFVRTLPFTVTLTHHSLDNNWGSVTGNASYCFLSWGTIRYVAR